MVCGCGPRCCSHRPTANGFSVNVQVPQYSSLDVAFRIAKRFSPGIITICRQPHSVSIAFPLCPWSVLGEERSKPFSVGGGTAFPCPIAV